jgi:RNA recognition motif-containing protein
MAKFLQQKSFSTKRQLSRGFGFIDMPDNAAALEAINKVNGSNFLGKNLLVDEARPKIVQSVTGFSRRE